MKTRTFNTVCAQGDIYIRKIHKLPKGAVEVAAEKGRHIVTHSETGHHHVMTAERVQMYRLPDSIMDCFLVLAAPAVLEHLRPHDTHAPIRFDKGTYHVRRQREHTPEGWRQVAD